MWKYWANILGAFLLLRVASSLMKDAEDLLRATAKPSVGADVPEEIADAEVVE